MKLLTVFLIIINTALFSQSAFSQKKKSKSKVENVHMYYDISPTPLNLDIGEWTLTIMKQIREKWDLNSMKANLSFTVEKNGTLSNPKISSEKWKPTKQDLIELNKIINSQGKWSVAKIGTKTVRGNYFLILEFN